MHDQLADRMHQTGGERGTLVQPDGQSQVTGQVGGVEAVAPELVEVDTAHRMETVIQRGITDCP